jgi:RHS repeat-associated protein
VQNLSYGAGRYPVSTADSAGHTQTSAYDPLFGVPIQTEAVDGIQTCYKYDALGWKTTEIARCGSTGPLSTTYARYKSVSAGSSMAKTVTVTSPPTNSKTWVYADVLGRTVETLGRSFDGNFIETLTEYDNMGRARPSKPFFPTDSQYWTTTAYDWLGRPYSVTQDLASVDGTTTQPSETSTSTIMTYDGSSTTTKSTINGITRTRIEQKNALGKVSKVTDANGVEIFYTYDVDGNLTDTLDPAGNAVHIVYDLRGRKTLTNDPDLHAWAYTYNGFGDLIEQEDANGKKTRMTYDTAGRMTTKTYDADTSNAATAEWQYDQGSILGTGKLAAMIGPPDSRLKAPCALPLGATQTSGNRAVRWFTYNDFGLVSDAFECVDGDTFSTHYDYDDLGRQQKVTYPEVKGAHFAVKYHYTSLGFLQYVSDAADDKVYWEAVAMNALGQVTDEKTRNGVETVSTRNKSTGWLLGQTVTSNADQDNLIQGLTNKFDEAGNLLTRKRSEPRDMADSAETFGYDVLDRLTSSEVKIASEGYDASEGYTYDQLGNITGKGDKSYSYTGCGGRPHAVCQVANTSFAYDSNGNMTNASLPEVGTGKIITYSPANRVIHISDKPGSVSNDTRTNIVGFMYGADGNRVVQSVGTDLQSDMARTVYVGLGDTGRSIYERTTRGSTIEHVHFIFAGSAHGGNAFALRAITEDTSAPGQSSSTDSPTMKYNHFDHLGSVTAMSDEMGKVLGPAWGGTNATALGYDAWGARRSPDGKAADPASSFTLQVGHREFTGHETIPNVGLVNMNGRVYDPELGRFLSPDPNVQFIANLQSYNRYSYVLNNPLRYTDPTGYSMDVAGFLVGAYIAVVGTVACAASYGAACVAFAIAGAVYSTTYAIGQGADPGQAIFFGVVNAYLGMVSGGVAAEAGLGPMGQILSGAISGAYASAMTTSVTGGRDLGTNILEGATQGAFAAAVGYTLRSSLSVSGQQGGSLSGTVDSEGYAEDAKTTIRAEVKATNLRATTEDGVTTVRFGIEIGRTSTSVEYYNGAGPDDPYVEGGTLGEHEDSHAASMKRWWTTKNVQSLMEERGMSTEFTVSAGTSNADIRSMVEMQRQDIGWTLKGMSNSYQALTIDHMQFNLPVPFYGIKSYSPPPSLALGVSYYGQ